MFTCSLYGMKTSGVAVPTHLWTRFAFVFTSVFRCNPPFHDLAFYFYHFPFFSNSHLCVFKFFLVSLYFNYFANFAMTVPSLLCDQSYMYLTRCLAHGYQYSWCIYHNHMLVGCSHCEFEFFIIFLIFFSDFPVSIVMKKMVPSTLLLFFPLILVTGHLLYIVLVRLSG